MTVSANITETAVSGKYGRVLIANAANALYPGNFQKWEVQISTENLPTTGFEDAGWADGLTGIVEAKISLSGPLQVGRATGLLAPIAQMLTIGARLVYECWLIHPDWSNAYGQLLRYTGVAQVVSNPNSNETPRIAEGSYELASRGPVYYPGQVAPSASAQLAVFLNKLGGGNPPS